jgi:alpha-ketoglutarate-dependent taurine dioxygenase
LTVHATKYPDIHRGVGSIIEPETPGGPIDEATFLSELKSAGAVLVRNVIKSEQEFIAFSDQYCHDFSTYRGGGFRFGSLDRKQIAGNETLLSTTGGTQGFPIPLHGEMYYMQERPSLIWFYCAQPPTAGGQTTLGDGIAIYAALKPETQHVLLTKKVKYIRQLADGDWQKTFQTDDVNVAIELSERNGATVSYEKETSTLRSEFVCPAVITHDGGRTGVWINNAVTLIYAEKAFESGWAAQNIQGVHSKQPPLIVRFEDDSKIPDAILKEVVTASESLTAEISWQPGDMIAVDNTWMLHGRRQDTGTGRSIYVRMGEPKFDFRPYGRAGAV